MDLTDILNIPPYSLDKNDKRELLNSYLNNLTIFHYKNCSHYAKMIDSTNFNIGSNVSYTELPFLPVRLLSCHLSFTCLEGLYCLFMNSVVNLHKEFAETFR